MKNNNLSDRVNNLSESATLEMTRLSRNLKAEGHDVITLSIGEPDFNTPEHIKEAAKKAINDNHTHYTPVSGFPELRKAIAGKLKRDCNLDYEPDQIVVSNGAKQSIANVILCIVNPGDEVIVPSPYWVSYPEIVKLAEGKMVEIPTTIETDFKVTPEQVEKAITEKTKAFIFSSPCNPTGSVYSKDELKAIAEVISKHKNIFIISDEIYEYINFKGTHESIAQFDFIKDQVIIVNGVSKGYAMTGWRIGYIAAPKFIAKACDTLQGQYTSGASSISQLAALKAIDTNPSDSEDLKKMLNAFNERRNLILKLLKEIPGIKANIPDGAFYVFPDISDYFGKSDGEKTINNSKDFCMYILEKVYVALVPGGAFGNQNCVRISYATSKELLIEAISRIKKALAELK
ncbi:MAG: pyridoxal phosphate-dependent aminotransferase [Bacteroidales bacterium]|nr:pyridoxal phosphate-dependent aminotransferase [Bacteroidales bacterium]